MPTFNSLRELTNHAAGEQVVLGSVEAGASVSSSTSIFVFGRYCLVQPGHHSLALLKHRKAPRSKLILASCRLSGSVRAGLSGDPSAVLVATQLAAADASIGSQSLPRSTSLVPMLGSAQGNVAVWRPVNSSAVQQSGGAIRQQLSAVQASPTARTALSTGCYISVAGLAVLVAPKAVFGLLFPHR